MKQISNDWLYFAIKKEPLFTLIYATINLMIME